MPPRSTYDYEPLVAELAMALRAGKGQGITVVDQPISGSRHRHLTVVWDKWMNVGQPDRGNIILDAFERAHPDRPWRVMEVTLAIGLTSSEDQKLNVA